MGAHLSGQPTLSMLTTELFSLFFDLSPLAVTVNDPNLISQPQLTLYLTGNQSERLRR